MGSTGGEAHVLVERFAEQSFSVHSIARRSFSFALKLSRTLRALVGLNMCA